MIRKEFNQHLTHPELLGAKEEEALRNVVDAFPYCQTARLLYSKCLKNQDSMLFEGQLSVAAAYCSDRNALHRLIHEISTMTEVIEEQVEVVEELTEPDVPAVEEPTSNIAEVDELDRQMRASLPNIPISEEDGSEASQETDEPKQPKERIKVRDKMTYGQWLHYFDDEDSERSSAEMIDEFIENEPRIGQLSEETSVIENLARQSSKDPEDALVTETLARIFLEQGNREKAIEIYQRLVLKYPEKSTYFASQIEFLKQQNPN